MSKIKKQTKNIVIAILFILWIVVYGIAVLHLFEGYNTIFCYSYISLSGVGWFIFFCIGLYRKNY